MIVLSIVAFIISSKGFSVLYLFLLADLFCCAFVVTVFYSFYNKKLNEKTAYISIIIGLIVGFLLFPAPDFSKSFLVGVLLPFDLFPQMIGLILSYNPLSIILSELRSILFLDIINWELISIPIFVSLCWTWLNGTILLPLQKFLHQRVLHSLHSSMLQSHLQL